MFGANSLSLSIPPHHLDPYDLTEVVTRPYHRLLAGLLGATLICIGSFWELRVPMYGRLSSLCEAFQPGRKETFGEKMLGEKIHGDASKLSSAVTICLCVLDLKNPLSYIVLTMELCPGGSDDCAGAVVKPAGGSTVSRPTTTGAGANSGAIRKQNASDRRRTDKINRRNKQQRRNGQGDGNDGGKHPRKGKRQFNVMVGIASRTFACPFCKLDPVRYFACATVTLTRIADVWQHILRKHVLSNNHYCSNCYSDYDNIAQLEYHQVHESCVQIAGPEHLFYQDVARLDPIIRGPSGHSSEEARWYRIWDSVFPHRRAPENPYAETLPELVERYLVSRQTFPNTQRFVRLYPEEVEVVQGNSLHLNDPHGLILGMNQPEISSLGMNQQGVNQSGMGYLGMNQQVVNQSGMGYLGMNQQGMNQFGVDQRGITQPALYVPNIGMGAQNLEMELLEYGFAEWGATNNHDDTQNEDFAEEEG